MDPKKLPMDQDQDQHEATPPLMDKEEETKLEISKESEVPATEITEVVQENSSEPSLATAEAGENTETDTVIDAPVKEISEVPATEITEVIEENSSFKTEEEESNNLLQQSEPSENTETGTVIDAPVKEISEVPATEITEVIEEEESNNLLQQSEPSLAMAEASENTVTDTVIDAPAKEISEVPATEITEVVQENRSFKTEEEESHNLLQQSEPSLAMAEASENTVTDTVIDAPAKEISEVPATEITEVVQENRSFKTEEEESHNLLQQSEPSLAMAEASENTVTGTVIDAPAKEISGAETAEEPVKEEIKEETKEIQSDGTLVSATLVTGTGVASVTQNPEEETKAIKDLKEGSKEAELPDPSVTATPDTEILEEDKRVELEKDEIKGAELRDVTSVAVSDVSPVTETTEKAEDKLPEEETEGPKLQDISVAATGEEEEGMEAELVKEEIKKSELPDSSLAATPIADAELIPGSKTSEAAAVKERALDELKIENPEASPVLAESEVTEVLPEKKKKKKPLGDHLAEEKANDSVNANKQASDENSEVELLEVEPSASAVTPEETTEISSGDLNTTHDTKKVEADEKEEDKKAVANAAIDVTATEVAGERQGEELAERESVEPAKGAKEEVASKLTSRNSNNLLSKVKHQIVKVRKAIVRKSPSSKNMHTVGE